MREKRSGGIRIKTKLIGSYIAVILVVVLTISLFAYYAVRQAIVRHALAQDQYLAEQLAANLSTRLKSMEELQFSQYLYSRLGDWLPITPTTMAEAINRERRIQDIISRLCYAKAHIAGAAVIDNEGRIYGTNLRSAHDALSEIERMDVQAVSARRGKVLWKVGSDGCLLMSRQLISINTTRPVGIIAMTIDPSFLTLVYDSATVNPKGNIVLFDSNRQLLPPDNPEMHDVAAAWLDRKSADGTHNFRFENRNYIITQQPLPENDFTLLHILDILALNTYTQNLPLMMLIVTLPAVLLALLFAHWISSMASSGISALVAGARRFGRGDLTTPVAVKSRDEIGDLAMEFNRMAEALSLLIEDIYDAERNKLAAESNALRFEYNALEAKINPHFLYNTLESVNSLAKIKGEEEISEIVCLLGTLLRDNISSTIDIIPLRQEFDNIQTYMRIQKLTYRDKFDINIRLDADVTEALVPKFILQPLVENAIYHGILGHAGHGQITLQAECVECDLCVTLTDDGAGMDGENLARLLDYTVEAKNDVGTHAKVGVRAVDKRLKILYGEKYGLQVESRLGHGTAVIVRMPLCLPGEEKP